MAKVNIITAAEAAAQVPDGAIILAPTLQHSSRIPTEVFGCAPTLQAMPYTSKP